MDWTQLFQSTVFPIAATIAMGFFIYTVYKDMLKRNEKAEEANKEREEKYIEIVKDTNALLVSCQQTNAKFVEQLEVMQASMKSIENDVDDIKDYLDLNKRASDNK